MKEKILHTANEMFLNFGFKSVTMDDIAEKLGISKKTIYTYYQTKTSLVKSCVMYVFESISLGIDHICSLQKNPIEELFEIKDFVLQNLNNEKSSPLFQLKKYYPNLYADLQKKQFEVMQECVKENLKRGIRLDMFRKDLDIDFITRIYFVGVTSIKDVDLFPTAKENMHGLMTNYLDYHISAIATQKGQKIVTKLIKK